MINLERLVDVHDRILNNTLVKAARPMLRKRTSIMELTFTTPEISVLDTKPSCPHRQTRRLSCTTWQTKTEWLVV